MEIAQKKHSNRVRYVFGDDELDYQLQDSSGSRSFSVGYAGISRDRQTLVERNQWLRNVGLLWILLGGVFTGISLTGDQGLKISVWLWVGLACYGAYHFFSTRYTIIPTESGNLLVIDDADGQRILDEIASRRAGYLRREFDFMPESESPEQHRGRFKWLHREGALSEDELKQRLATIDAMDPGRATVVAPEPGARLN
jgi:hypothetical protein